MESPVFVSEVSMEVQSALGSDIVMAFDECAPGDADETVARTSMELTDAGQGRLVNALK